MNDLNLSREQIFEKYLPVFRNFAKCKNLEFLESEVTGNSAILYYKSTDDCQKDKINIKKEIIYMVNEDGWKIDDNDIQEF